MWEYGYRHLLEIEDASRSDLLLISNSSFSFPLFVNWGLGSDQTQAQVQISVASHECICIRCIHEHLVPSRLRNR
jgi:hypothetical protein